MKLMHSEWKDSGGFWENVRMGSGMRRPISSIWTWIH